VNNSGSINGLYNANSFYWDPQLTTAGNYVFFADNTLYRTDGTISGTMSLNNGNISGPAGLMEFNGSCLFFNGSRLWKSDGTISGTTLVTSFNLENPYNLKRFREYQKFNGSLYFSAKQDATGYELWRTDGTENGTSLVSDINIGSSSSNPEYLMVSSNTLFFSATNGVSGTELYACTLPTPISDLTQQKNNLIIYPNPSIDEVTIDLSNNELSQCRRIELSNTQGKVVYSNHTNQLNKINIDLKDWDNGLYIIKVFDNNGNMMNSKIVICK
jgi:ELWxxDGT repeat protein